MLVISDASPINVLVRIDLVEVLQKLFGKVIIPPAVASELSHPNTPPKVLKWIQSRPAWLEICSPLAIVQGLSLDAGESEAISLAQELGADFLLVDDLKARRAARRMGIPITGTLGILERAARQDLINLVQAIDRIRQTDFAVSDELVELILSRYRRGD